MCLRWMTTYLVFIALLQQGPDVRKTINDALLLRAVPAKSLHVPDGTWKTIAETMLDLPFDRMKKIDAATMVSSGLEKELLMLDEQAVSNIHTHCYICSS